MEHKDDFMEAVVFDIKRFAVHDGPGIRSSVFLKGCPLNCLWCHNPEGISAEIQLWYFANQCLRCGDCAAACPQKALTLTRERGIVIDREKCNNCGICTEVCPTRALTFIGRKMTIDEVEKELLKDNVFYEESGGGITLTGGEPLAQNAAALEILKRMKARGIHTALETSLQVSLEVLKELPEVCDFFMCDLKIIDPAGHKKFVGRDNALILTNLKWLAEQNTDILVRVPIIPGFTDSEENLKGIAQFLLTLKRKLPVELMNFNPLARDKFRILGRPYEPKEADRPYTEEQMASFREIFLAAGLAVL